MSRAALRVYLLLALVALTIKIPLLLYNYECGFLARDLNVVTPDSIFYIHKALYRPPEIRLFGHWFYEFLNRIACGLLGDDHRPWLAMSALNTLLSLLMPLALLPATRRLCPDPARHERYFALLCVLVLFWPTALWLSSQNLKDTLLAFLVGAFVSLIARATDPDPAHRPPALVSLAGGVLILYLVFSVRSYLAAFLALAALIQMVWGERSAKMAFVALAAGGILFALPVGQQAREMARFENNWLVNPQAMEEVNERVTAGGEGRFVVNTNARAVLMDLPKTVLNPFPTLALKGIPDLLLVTRTILVSLFLGVFVAGLWRWRARFKLFLCACLLLPLLFYGVVPSYAGPRQVFSSGVEIVFLLLLPLFLIEYRPRFTLGASFALGATANLLLLIFTSKGLP